MRVVSLNAWGGARWDHLAEWLPVCGADIVCVQEVTRTPGVVGRARFADGERDLPQRADLFADMAALLPRHQRIFVACDAGPVHDDDGHVHRQQFGIATFVDDRLPVVAVTAAHVHGTFADHERWPTTGRPRAALAVRVHDPDTGRGSDRRPPPRPAGRGGQARHARSQGAGRTDRRARRADPTARRPHGRLWRPQRPSRQRDARRPQRGAGAGRPRRHRGHPHLAVREGHQACELHARLRPAVRRRLRDRGRPRGVRPPATRPRLPTVTGRGGSRRRAASDVERAVTEPSARSPATVPPASRAFGGRCLRGLARRRRGRRGP